MIYIFMKAWLIGIAVAAPVGPIGLLCIRKTLEIGFKGAILVGLGAAIADSIYGLIAAFGLTAISHFLIEKVGILKTIGGVFLLYLAYKEIHSPNPRTKTELQLSNTKLILTTLLLTLTNPMTILSFIGIFAALTTQDTTINNSLLMVWGIFLGSMTWWLILGICIVKLKHKLPAHYLKPINYISALILSIFGIAAIISIF